MYPTMTSPYLSNNSGNNYGQQRSFSSEAPAVFQANVVHINDSSAFNAFLNPNQHPSNKEYFREEMERAQNIVHNVAGFARKAFEGAITMYNKFNDSTFIRQAKSAVRRVRDFFRPDEIQPYDTIEAMYDANGIMQRYIMAEPQLRTAYHNHQVDGYFDDYTDWEPNKVGAAQYDFRRVTNSVIMTDDDEFDTVTSHHYEELFDGDRELEIEEKAYVLSTWDALRLFMGKGFDPTDKVNKGQLLA